MLWAKVIRHHFKLEKPQGVHLLAEEWHNRKMFVKENYQRRAVTNQ
jgi:hypothetical protein